MSDYYRKPYKSNKGSDQENKTQKNNNIRKATKKKTQYLWPDSVISVQVREGNSDGRLSKHDALQTDHFNLSACSTLRKHGFDVAF